MIGWANARVEASRLKVDVAFVETPKESDFRIELDAEVERLKVFLN